MEQLDLQKRLIIALSLSFLVFVGSSYFMGGVMPATTAQDTNQSTRKQQAGNQAPAVASSSTTTASAPVSQNTTSAPIQNSGTVLATISSETSLITIDEFGRIAQVVLLRSCWSEAS